MGRPLPDRVPTQSATRSPYFPLEEHQSWSFIETQVWKRLHLHFPPPSASKPFCSPAYQPRPIRPSSWSSVPGFDKSQASPSREGAGGGDHTVPQLSLDLTLHARVRCITRAPASQDLWSHIPPLAWASAHMGPHCHSHTSVQMAPW